MYLSLDPHPFTESCHDFWSLIIIEGQGSEKESIMRCTSNIYWEVRSFMENGFISSMSIYFFVKFNRGSPFILLVAVVVIFVDDC